MHISGLARGDRHSMSCSGRLSAGGGWNVGRENNRSFPHTSVRHAIPQQALLMNPNAPLQARNEMGTLSVTRLSGHFRHSSGARSLFTPTAAYR